MGRTKALIEIAGRAMGDRVADALRSVGADPVLFVGGDPHELEGLSAPVVPDRYPGEGPVGGVLTALDHLATRSGPDSVDAAVVLSCDLADVTADALWPLLDAAAGDARSRVWVAAGDRMEPMCALWSVQARGVVRERFVVGERALHRVIAELPHTTVTVDAGALRNVNRPEDLVPPESER
jgi:molybdopterin-guanine dinucleotide biosynthesis protein A